MDLNSSLRLLCNLYNKYKDYFNFKIEIKYILETKGIRITYNQ
jgi:hypothetical protein